MATILLLPAELIQRIGDFTVAFEDVQRLRLVCRQLGEFLETQILNTVVLNIHKNSLERSIHMLQSLATSRTTATSRSTQCLVIRSLSPAFNPAPLTAFAIPLDREIGWRTTLEPAVVSSEAITAATECMKACLLDALVSFKRLHSVRWKMESKDEEWAQSIVMTAVQAIPSLRSLNVSLHHPCISLQLQLFPHLSEITLKEGTTVASRVHNLQTFANLAQLIAQSPSNQLRSIHVERGSRDSLCSDPEPSVHDLFKCLPEDAQSLRIRHLGIRNSFLKLDAFTVRHLRHITSLDISNLIQPSNHVSIGRKTLLSGEPQLIAPEIFERQCAIGSTADQLWADFSQLGIHLENISLDHIVPSFFEYLQSYSGLKKLILRIRGFKSRHESDASASFFFNEVLPQHAASLEELNIEAYFEGLWCFGETNTSTLSDCRSLRKLQICILSDQMKDLNQHNMLQGECAAEDTIDNLLEITSYFMPRLVSLKISPANKESNRGSRLGARALAHYSSVSTKLTEHIRAYIGPSTLSRLPEVHIGGKVFEPIRISISVPVPPGASQWQWRYWLAYQSKQIDD